MLQNYFAFLIIKYKFRQEVTLIRWYNKKGIIKYVYK